MRKRVLGAAGICVLFVSVTAIFLASDTDIGHLRSLRLNHAEVVGQVVGLHPENHGVVDVRYVVAGSAFQEPLLPGRVVARGDLVRVYYSPNDPAVAVMSPPDELLDDQLHFFLWGSLFMSLVASAGVLLLWRNSYSSRRRTVG